MAVSVFGHKGVHPVMHPPEAFSSLTKSQSFHTTPRHARRRAPKPRLGEIDYKTYLDFVLASWYKKTNESLCYFFRLLDVEKKGGLSAFDINYYFRAIVHGSKEAGQEPVVLEDVRDEIFDMVKPADPLRITLADLLACKVGDTVVSMLTDVHGFWAYDNREMLMHKDNN
jgi:hypothetical protein